MHGKASELRGVLPALITPYDAKGKIDEMFLCKQADYLISSGVQGLFLTGTTSEGALLTSEEKVRILELIKSQITGDQLVCSALLAADTRSTQHEIDMIAPLEPDFISVITPLYYGVSQKEVLQHFVSIADHSPVPVIIYNIPQNTNNTISLETLLELAEHPNVVGVKDSSGNFMNFQRGLLTTREKSFTWIQGEDLLDAAALLMGTKCLVTGLGNAWIEPYVLMYRASLAGDSEEIILQQSRINSLARIIYSTGGKGIPSIKCAAEIMGRSSSRMRITGMELSSDEKIKVREVLSGLGIL